jgi:hypothetical protein
LLDNAKEALIYSAAQSLRVVADANMLVPVCCGEVHLAKCWMPRVGEHSTLYQCSLA